MNARNVPGGRQDVLSRRSLLGLGGAALVTWSLAGCDSGRPGDGSSPTTPAAGQGGEAPELAKMVEAGELPPLEERLPETPVVIESVERVGVYGGTWRTALTGPADRVWINRTVGHDPLLRWNPDLTETVPNIAEAIEANTDSSVYTIRLRPGMRWSDGHPFTADDIVFALNDVMHNENLVPAAATARAATFGVAEKIDDHTVNVTFDAPDGLFPLFEAKRGRLVTRPKHYLSQFHQSYADVSELVAKEEVEKWEDLFWLKADSYNNPEVPSLNAWVVTTPLNEATRAVFKRNPYYWKVDTAGNQLPYIDEVVFDIAEPEVMLLKAANGEFDMHVRHFVSPENKPVLAQGREAGGYDFFDTTPGNMNEMLLVLNQTVEDPVKRQVFQNKDFRIGLSHAINRQEIIDAVYQRQGEPWQAAPRPESALYDEEMAKQYTEYDIDKANEHLDLAGYAERDGDGFRLDPDGNRISLGIEFSSESYADALGLVEEYWEAVGVQVNLQLESRELFIERASANQTEVIVWGGDGGLHPSWVPDWYFADSAYLEFAPLWADWYASEGEEGTEPPELVRRQMEIYDQVKRSSDLDEQNRLMKEVLAITKQEFWVIGTVLNPPGYGIVKNNFHNVPQMMMMAAQINTPGPTNPPQYFIE